MKDQRAPGSLLWTRGVTRQLHETDPPGTLPKPCSAGFIEIEQVIEDLTKSEVQQSRWKRVLCIQKVPHQGFSSVHAESVFGICCDGRGDIQRKGGKMLRKSSIWLAVFDSVMGHRIKWIKAGVLGVIAIHLFTTRAIAGEAVLVHDIAPPHPRYKNFYEMVAEVAKRTSGLLTIAINPGGKVLYPGQASLDAVRSGQAPLTFVNSAFLQSINPSLGFINLPFTVNDEMMQTGCCGGDHQVDADLCGAKWPPGTGHDAWRGYNLCF